MATIQSSIQLFDGMTPVLRKITNSINTVISSFESMERASGHAFDTAELQGAREQLIQVEAEFDQIDQAIEKAKKQNEQLNDSIDRGGEKAGGLRETWDKLSGVLGAVGIAAGAKEILTGANDYRMAGNTVQGRTGMQGEDLELAKQSVKNLYAGNMGDSLDDVATSLSTVYQLTRRTGDGLEQMTRAGLLLRDTYGFEVTESVRTAEMMEKQFGISGAQAFDLIVQGAQAGLDKNGDLLDTINEYSVQFKKIGFDSVDMFNMLINGARSGTFSVDKLGDTIKEFSIRAIDGSDTTKEGFEAIGLNANRMAASFGQGGEAAKTAFQQTIDAISKMDDPIKRNIAGVNLFGTMWEDLGYEGVMALVNLNGSVELTTQNLEDLNNVKYDDATSALASLGRTINMGLSGVVGSVVNTVTRHMNDFTTGLQGNANEIQGIFGGIGLGAGIFGRAIYDNWSIIEPIMWGIIAVLGIYTSALIANNTVQGISNGIKLIAATMAVAHGTMTAAEAAATTGATAAQIAFNAAILACPITWIIVGIIALVAIFYAAVAAVNHFSNTSISATGLVAGAFAVLGAYIINTFVIPVWNAIATFINFFYNVWNDPIAAVKVLFLDLANTVIGYVLNMAKTIENIINKIPGVQVNITSGLDQFKNRIEAMSAGIKSEAEWKEIIKTKEFIDYSDAAKAGYGFGQGVSKKIGGAFDSIKGSVGAFDSASGIPGTWDGIYGNTGDTAGNTASMADSMDLMEEDLKYMRDAAEQEIINRFTLAELKVDVNNHNTLKTQTDFDDVNRMLGDVTAEILEAAAEGGGHV